MWHGNATGTVYEQLFQISCLSQRKKDEGESRGPLLYGNKAVVFWSRQHQALSKFVRVDVTGFISLVQGGVHEAALGIGNHFHLERATPCGRAQRFWPHYLRPTAILGLYGPLVWTSLVKSAYEGGHFDYMPVHPHHARSAISCSVVGS